METEERWEKINRKIDELHTGIEKIARKEIESIDIVIAEAEKLCEFPSKSEVINLYAILIVAGIILIGLFVIHIIF